MTQGEKRHKHIGQTPPPHTPTYILKKKKKDRVTQSRQTGKERREASQIHLVLCQSRCVEEGTVGERDVAGTLIQYKPGGEISVNKIVKDTLEGQRGFNAAA